MASRKSKQTLRSKFANLTRIAVIVMLLVALIVVVLLLGQGKIFQRPGAAADASFYLNAGNAVLTTGKTVKLMLDTGAKSVNFVDVSLRFDPAFISLSSQGITTSDALKTVVIKSTPQEAANGVIRLTIAAEPGDALPSGVLQVAQFEVKKNPSVTQNNQTTSIIFDTNSTQVVDSSARNLSLETKNLVLSINPTASSTPGVVATPRTTPLVTPVSQPSTTEYRVRLANIPNANSAADLFDFNYVNIGGRAYQENDAMFTYFGRWRSTSSTRYTTNTASVSFTTKESSIRLGTSKGPNRGKIQVYVNDRLKQTLEFTQSQTQQYEVQISLR